VLRQALPCPLALVLILLASPAAAIDWLVFVIDRSASIDAAEYALQRNAYVRLLADEDALDALGGATVAIVEFDSRPEVMVEWSEPAAAGKAYAAAPLALERAQTGIGRALERALALLDGKPGRRVIDVSGDGRENVDSLQLMRVREQAIERGIEINGLAILNPRVPTLERYYASRVATGFVITVAESGEFYAALKRKFLLEVAGLPPGGPLNDR
jgi:hypothetical protein